MAAKVSYVSVLNKVINGEPLTTDEMTKIETLRDQMEKRNSTKSGKPTKTQVANAAIANAVYAAMEPGVSYDVATIKGMVPELADANPQRVAPLMKKLVDAGKVSLAKVKGKNFYTRISE